VGNYTMTRDNLLFLFFSFLSFFFFSSSLTLSFSRFLVLSYLSPFSLLSFSSFFFLSFTFLQSLLLFFFARIQFRLACLVNRRATGISLEKGSFCQCRWTGSWARPEMQSAKYRPMYRSPALAPAASGRPEGLQLMGSSRSHDDTHRDPG
jgi:hypothetical protein